MFFLQLLIPQQAIVYSQTPTISEINNIPAEELQGLVNQAKEKGFTEQQIKAFAKTKGLSPSQISELEQRVIGGKEVTETEDALAIEENEKEAPTKTKGIVAMSNDPLFGYGFFNNPNVSFQPNVNLATPASYQLGPGDGLVVSLWGAAENSYNLVVNKNGEVKIPNIGPLLVSGMSFDKASQKIESQLLKVYAGIAAPSSSPYKIFTDVSLSKVRTVQVNIIGQVKVPGTYSLSALSTVLNALYACGGPSRGGTFREIKLIRNGKEIAEFDVYKYLLEGSQEGNETIKDQDLILVGAYISKISVDGEVKRPGVYEIKPNENFQDLMRYVSGFTSNAYKQNIKLVRIEGDRKILKEIDYTNFKTEALFDGDIINIGGILGGIKNSISITGSVLRPGDYEYTPNLTISQLIYKASGITASAYLKRGLITRVVDGISRDIASFSVEAVLNGTDDRELQPNDIVTIFSQSVVNQKGSISISGAVQNSISIPFEAGITLENLVILANGYQKKANTAVIDVTREVIDEDYNTINQLFKISAESSLDIINNTPFEFMPNDKVIVRYLKGSSDQQFASIEGEVSYPGQYYAETKNEKILDLLEKSGGLSPYAFEEAATLIRLNPFYRDISQSLTSESLNLDESIEEVKTDLNNQKEFRLGIDLKQLLIDGEDSKQNLVLKNGDRLIIPSIKETVKIEGQVMLPNLVRFEDNFSLKEYISKSGGFSSNAKKSKTYVIHPNGDIATTKKFLFFRSYPKVKPGSLILVPGKPERNKLSTQEVIGGATGLATLAFLVVSIFR